MLCILCPIGEHISMSSFRVFVHDGLSSSCTKEMHTVRKLSVWFKIPIWSNSLTLSNASELFWNWISINHIQVHEENEFCYCLFTSFTKREIRHFHGYSCSWRQRNVQKSVMRVESSCFFNLSSYYLLDFLIAAASNCDPSKTEYPQGKFNCPCW